MTYYVGIDNSSLDHKVCILNNEGNLYSQFTIENNLAGFNELGTQLKNLDKVLIGFELPHGPLVDYLKTKNYTTYSLNPLKIKRFKETITVSGNKNDKIDAAAIAEYLRRNHNQCRPMIYSSSEVEKLKMLCIIHNRMTEEHSRYINKLHFAVRQYFYLHESLFSHFGCTVQLKMLIKYPTFDDLRQASDEELILFLKSNHYHNPKYITKLLGKIREHDQLISPDVVYAYLHEVNMLCEIMSSIERSLKDIEKEMIGILDNHHLGKIFRSIPGVGTILGSNLLALFGDNMNRFDNANQAQCLFGTAPKNYQSGSYHKVTMRKACNKYARAILYRFAFETLIHCQWARVYYDMQKTKGKKHSVAIRALSNKWVKVIYRLWKDEIFYEEDKKLVAAA